MDETKAAVIGLGRMGAFPSEKVLKYAPDCWFPLSHLESLNVSDDIDVVAVCDQSSASIERVHAAFGDIKAYLDFEEMLADCRPELVCIASRTPGRAELIRRCVENGVKAIHLEKPLCNSVAELATLRSLTQMNNTVLSYGALRRCFRIYQRAKELVDSGQFGELVQIDVSFGHSQLFWSHPHSIDIVLFFAGDRRFESLRAHLSEVEVDDLFPQNRILSDPLVDFAVLNFSNNVSAVISRSQGMNIVLNCSAGKISVLADGRTLVTESLDGQDPYFKTSNTLLSDSEPCNPEVTYSALSPLIARMRSNTQPFVSKHDDWNHDIFLGQEILFLMAQSHLQRGSELTIADLNEKMEILAKSDDFYA